MPAPTAERQQRGLSSSLHRLSLTPFPHPSVARPKPRTPPAATAAATLADSWEEEATNSSSPSSGSSSPPQTPASVSLPQAPPPTPISSIHSSSFRAHYDLSSAHFPSTSTSRQAPFAEVEKEKMLNHRPEKQVAVAGRMIAGALGVKAAPKSEEARAYERAVREKERKRLAKEKEGKRAEVEAAERAKRQVWDD